MTEKVRFEKLYHSEPSMDGVVFGYYCHDTGTLIENVYGFSFSRPDFYKVYCNGEETIGCLKLSEAKACAAANARSSVAGDIIEKYHLVGRG